MLLTVLLLVLSIGMGATLQAQQDPLAAIGKMMAEARDEIDAFEKSNPAAGAQRD